MGYRQPATATVIGVVDWKKAVLVALVVLLVLVGVAVLMPGMSGASCVDCDRAVTAGAACAGAAVLAGFVFAIALLAQMIRARRDRLFDLLRAVGFDRPPQLA